MKFKGILPLLLVFFICGTVHAGTTGAQGEARQTQGDIDAQVQEIQGKLLNDEGIMALILSMQNDPEVQALLSDPAVVNAVAAGDVKALADNPRFMQLLNKPQVREIQKRVNR
ncbi:hypothetical protein [Geotalea uraniireducens]|uniref:STI1 domain-containing protein n=1 Tax=Geotalea uraniireducens (strain Rf4) TaxID=351605 RepID=A5GC35_GEOUR|nr:hypothetical protein [Geotalea uraniireducens]ABQ24855.1 hypothetical protein Gura_0643 [Geotalea uraniireducens Rf4]